MVAASLDLTGIQFLCGRVPRHTVLLSQSLRHILQNRFRIPGVINLGSILIDLSFMAAHGTVIQAVIIVYFRIEAAADVLEITSGVAAGGHTILIRNTGWLRHILPG